MWFVVKGGWPQMILLFLIMRCTPTIRKLIEATPLSLSSPSATSLSALAPAQRAGAQRLRALCRFSDAGMTKLSPGTGGRRPKSAKARNRGRWGTDGAVGAMGILPRARAWEDG